MDHNLIFPSVISNTRLDLLEFDKLDMLEACFNWIDENGYTMDAHGFPDVHHEPAFKEIYVHAAASLREHLRFMNIPENQFDVNFVKSWLWITDDNNNDMHNHAEAHYSMTYYLNQPIGKEKNLIFTRGAERPSHNDIYDAWLDNTCNQWDIQNSTTWQFKPLEGDLYIFPANILHETKNASGQNDWNGMISVKSPSELLSKRICIGMDVLLTAKEKTNNHRWLQPVKSWRTFD